MREFTKSMFSVSWALSLLGVKQMMGVLTPGQSQTQAEGAGVFDRITENTVQEFDDSMKGIFRSGDKMQRRFIDMMFSLSPPMGRNGARAAADGGDSAGGFASASTSRQSSAGGDSGEYSGSSGDWGAMPSSSSEPPCQCSTAGKGDDAGGETGSVSAGWGPMPTTVSK
jgi:hypothetical protein